MSQHEYSDHIKQHYYEGDQSKLYSGIMNHHFNHDTKSPESKKQIGRIWKVFWLLLVITVVEVGCGLLAYKYDFASKGVLAVIFLVLTLVKARYIVSIFMHLGDEFKNFIVMILIPLTLFIWFIIAFLMDGSFWLQMNTTTPVR